MAESATAVINPKTTNMSTHYVIATWSGPRRGDNFSYENDRACFLRRHLEKLTKLNHNLSQITVAVPHNPDESSKFDAYIKSLPDNLAGTPLQVLHRDNKGQSYGSYSDVYAQHRDNFDYYIFIEDDYIPSQDNFDKELITIFNEKPNCGYLCSLFLDNEYGPHAALSNGITSSEVLELIWEKFGEIPHQEVYKYSSSSQIAFSRSFLKVGREIHDTTCKYRAPFNRLGHLVVHAEHNSEDLIIPLHFEKQLLGHKILILLLYYDRPEMVKLALNSIKSSSYKNWELAFIDDGSAHVGAPVCKEILKDDLDKVTFYRIPDTVEEKVARGGSLVGKYMNIAISGSDAELAIMLCDDDALKDDYLSNLNQFFLQNPTEQYCYSHVILFDPFKETPETIDEKTSIRVPSLNNTLTNRIYHFWNKNGPINAANAVDAAQVAWKTDSNVKFPYPQTRNLDATFYGQMHRQYGPCPFSGFFGQYKGIYADALDLRRGSNEYAPKDLVND